MTTVKKSRYSELGSLTSIDHSHSIEASGRKQSGRILGITNELSEVVGDATGAVISRCGAVAKVILTLGSTPGTFRTGRI